MCKSKRDTVSTAPQPRQSSPVIPNSITTTTTSSSSATTTATTSSSSRSSLSSLRSSLPESPIIYAFAEISAATNAFLSKPIPSSPPSSPAWRCLLRGRDAVVHRRSFLRHSDAARLRDRLASVSRGHHVSLVRLLGAAAAGGGSDHLYVVYEHVPGATLSECLRNPRNPEFTVLSTWLSRMQVAADLAQGLEYIHHYASAAGPPNARRTFIHSLLDSSSVLVTEPSLNAKICHFGSSILAGDVPEEESATDSPPGLERSDSRTMKIERTRGYMAPEVEISQKSDVFALGVLLLELLSGEEPLKYRFDRETKQYEMVSVIEGEGGDGIDGGDREKGEAAAVDGWEAQGLVPGGGGGEDGEGGDGVRGGGGGEEAEHEEGGGEGVEAVSGVEGVGGAVEDSDGVVCFFGPSITDPVVESQKIGRVVFIFLFLIWD
ncbi:LysM domain receptor-like kinase 3 [Acorus calamus]|uniref:LysM domain receptor-like kinase 3 n=1 Tax=Acorus calamus TaxID=4465 RepID=A0AAV9CNV2_ACOCL|nr:LysM domain receptor-like kinase 3 [Acorus calamus]